MRVKTAAKRDAILAAAGEVFKESGFEGASMAEISARIGGSKGTLYAYFKSKEELFVGVMHQEAKKQLDPILDALDSDTGDLETTLLILGEKVVGFLCQDSSIQTRRMILAESGRSDIGRRFHEEGPKIGMQRVAAFMKRQMDAGRLRQGDPILATLQLSALLDCETVTPMMLGLETSISPARIKLLVGRAIETFLAAYAVR
jgi:AcrR family transcriptional regulator